MKWCAAETVLHAEFVTIPNLRCIAKALHCVREKSVRNSEWLPHSLFTISLFVPRILRRQMPAHRVEAGLLIVAERVVEISKRRLHQLDALQHGLQTLPDRCHPRWRGRRNVVGACHLDRVGCPRRR